MSSNTPEKETVWYTGRFQYEGFPLLLRFPEKPDFDRLQTLYTKLVMIEHHLSAVQSSGLPEVEYNSSLLEFDQKVLGIFSDSALPVLVETYAGKRTYYLYVTTDADIEGVKVRIGAQFPEHKLEWSVKDGEHFWLIKRYAEDYSFYKKGLTRRQSQRSWLSRLMLRMSRASHDRGSS